MAGKQTTRFSSRRLVALAPLVAAALLAACAGGTGGGGALPASSSSAQNSYRIASTAAVASSAALESSASYDDPSEDVAPGTLPTQGVYNSCEIDTALTSMCEQEDAAIASDGFKWEINYIGIDAYKTGPQSLQAWFTYDASIGLGQVISIKAAINDPTDVLTGNALEKTSTNSLARSCGATNNEQLISCIASVAQSVPKFHWKWYLYDEPGCPYQSIGYCQGTLAGGNYDNVATLAKYIHEVDPGHRVIGTNSGDSGGQPVINNLYSWLTTSNQTSAGFDHYPVPSGGIFGTIGDIGSVASELASTIQTTNPAEHMYFVGQAFSWYQEGGSGCSSITVCPYPTTAEIQEMRDQALYYANQAGHPLSHIFWYYWPDITCLNSYPGCNAAANRASLKAAAFAPFPTTAPL